MAINIYRLYRQNIILLRYWKTTFQNNLISLSLNNVVRMMVHNNKLFSFYYYPISLNYFLEDWIADMKAVLGTK